MNFKGDLSPVMLKETFHDKDRQKNFHSSADLRRVDFGLGQLKLIKHSSNQTKIYCESIACTE